MNCSVQLNTTIDASKRSSSSTVAGWTTTTYTTTSATVGVLKVAPSGLGYRIFFVANEAEDESQILQSRQRNIWTIRWNGKYSESPCCQDVQIHQRKGERRVACVKTLAGVQMLLQVYHLKKYCFDLERA